MAEFVDPKEWTELVNRVNEMELKLQHKENDVNSAMEKRKADNSNQGKLMESRSQEEVFTWEIPNLRETNNTVDVTSPLLSLQCFPIGFYVKSDLRSRYQFGTTYKELSFWLIFDTKNDEALTKLPFDPTVTYTICDVTENEYKRDIIRFVERPLQDKSNPELYKTTSDWASLENPRYFSKDNILTLKIGVSFDYPQPKEDIVRWKVEHYMLKRLLCMNNLINSYPVKCIETHGKGYRVRIKQQFVRDMFVVAVQFLTGEFDDNLNKVFPHVTTVVVENQWDPSAGKSLVKTMVKQDNLDEYKLEMATHQELEAGGYLVDDTLKLKLFIVEI